MADAAGAVMPGMMAGDAMPNAVDLAQRLDIQMDQLAGPLARVAHHRRFGIETGAPAEAEPAQHRPDGRARQPEPFGDQSSGQVLPAQPFDRPVPFAAGAIAVSATAQPASSIPRTIRSRPCGVSRAFLWTFIRGPCGLQLSGGNHSFPVLPRMNNLQSFNS